MTYLFFSGSLKTGGAERSLSRLVNYLVSDGREVHLVLRQNVVQFHLDSRVQIHVLPHGKRHGKISKVLQGRRELRKIIGLVDPHVCCAFTGLSGVFLASAFAKNTVIRFGTYPRALMWWKQLLFYSFFSLPHVKKIICLTHDMKHDLRRVLPKKKLEVINNSAITPVPSQANFYEEFPMLRDKEFIASMGRLTSGKAYDVALKAYERSRSYLLFDYVMIGNGPVLNNLKQLVGELRLENYVHFVGYQPNPYALLSRAKFFVHTSEREGFPNVLVESLSLGVPVLATDCKTGPSEIVQHGVNGFLVPVGATDEVAYFMTVLGQDEAVLNNLIGNAVESTRRFDENTIFTRWMEILGDVVSLPLLIKRPVRRQSSGKF